MLKTELSYTTSTSTRPQHAFKQFLQAQDRNTTPTLTPRGVRWLRRGLRAGARGDKFLRGQEGCEGICLVLHLQQLTNLPEFTRFSLGLHLFQFKSVDVTIFQRILDWGPSLLLNRSIFRKIISAYSMDIRLSAIDTLFLACLKVYWRCCQTVMAYRWLSASPSQRPPFP